MKEIKTEFDATLKYGTEFNTKLKGLIIESRGGTKASNNYRNPEHSLLLAFVLKKLQNNKVSDLEIYIASNSYSYKDNSKRKISFNEDFKIDLTKTRGFEAFLKSIKKSIKESGQKENSSGGNSTKKILLCSQSFDLEKILENPIISLIENELEEDQLEYIFQKVKKRFRQSKFRAELLKAYDKTCIVTGSKVERLLEAAHIQPYTGYQSNIINNGILLRSDIHDLFDIYQDDKRLITITENYIIEVHPSLQDSEYWKYHNQKIKLPVNPHNYPDFSTNKQK
jgi:hypothetical protein